MTAAYETVKYYGGGIGGVRADTNVQGFADPNYYDQVKSPLSRPGGTRSILGQGGLLDTGIGIYEDLQSGSVAGVIGALQKAGTARQTFRNVNLGQIASQELKDGALTALRSTVPGQVRYQPGGQQGSSIQERLRAPVFPTPARRNDTTGGGGGGG